MTQKPCKTSTTNPQKGHCIGNNATELFIDINISSVGNEYTNLLFYCLTNFNQLCPLSIFLLINSFFIQKTKEFENCEDLHAYRSWIIHKKWNFGKYFEKIHANNPLHTLSFSFNLYTIYSRRLCLDIIHSTQLVASVITVYSV